MNPFLARQLATYASYHRDWRNRATHFIGIPLIVFAIYIPLAMVELATPWGRPVDLALIVFVAAVLFYAWLDWFLGLAMTLAIWPLWWLGIHAATLPPATAWGLFAAGFVGGWVFQIVGHVFEGRRPALVDNLIQALIGPLFLVVEVIVALGFRPDLAPAIDTKAR
jgi:uncharacterized membrane protein YGL010W